ncbi:immunoglobulin alpha Fc receptor-like [Castor canadensis]|uniref:immunoglobulin alpha Fc receptor-like n=1 Tax=Castor canadensis TaxID=51338 RepID=UPI003D16B0D8
MIPENSSVTIFCRIPPGVTRMKLRHAKPRDQGYYQTLQEAQEVAEFFLQHATNVSAGTYDCTYKDKPSLTVHPGPQVASGRNVTLFCHLLFYDTFILCRDGEASFPQDCSHQDHNTFLISHGDLAYGGTYRCYGSSRHTLYLGTLPSDPIELSVTGSSPSDYKGNIIQLSLAGLLLLTLGALLLDAWKSRKSVQGGIQGVPE